MLYIIYTSYYIHFAFRTSKYHSPEMTIFWELIEKLELNKYFGMPSLQLPLVMLMNYDHDSMQIYQKFKY